MSRPFGDVDGASESLPTKVKEYKSQNISNAKLFSSTSTDLLYLQNKSRREAQASHDVFAFFIDGVAFAGFCRVVFLVYFLNRKKTRNRFEPDADHLLLMTGGLL